MVADAIDAIDAMEQEQCRCFGVGCAADALLDRLTQKIGDNGGDAALS